MNQKTQFVGLMIGLSLAIVMGCSRINPVDSSNAQGGLETLPTNNLTHYQYPEAANCAPPGYQFVSIIDPNQCNVDDFWTCTYMLDQYGGWLWLMGSNIHVMPYSLPYNTWIAMYRENMCTPWIDYEPHGLVFEGAAFARISYAGCQLQPPVPPGDLTIWYWHEEIQQYELIGGANNIGQQYIQFEIDHFSRYVVASQL
jgi:hypothetical protein